MTPDLSLPLLGAALVLPAAVLLRRPLGLLLRLLIRTGAGLAALACFSLLRPLLGFSLGVNLFNAVVLGLLGGPGFALLLMLQWLLR